MTTISNAYDSFLAVLPFALFWVGFAITMVYFYARFKFRRKR